MQKITPVLLAGGLGSRLWPLSREHYPKQLLTFFGENSLLQATLHRVLQHPQVERFIVICNELHRFEVLQQIEQLNPSCEFIILLEPKGRNTAAASAMAAFCAEANELLLVVPADHLLEPTQNFLDAVKIAMEIASNEKLVTFGIQPSYAETGYGYIYAKQLLQKNVFNIENFVEKPNLTTAKKYLADGHYFWNSGMFLFSARTYLKELQQHAPDIYSIMQACTKEPKKDGSFVRINEKIFLECPNISIDYAIMEKTKNSAMIKLDINWNDIGSWKSIYDCEKKVVEGNVTNGDVISINNENCYINSHSRLVATVGLKNIMVIETADSILVIDKDKTQDVKKIITVLQDQKRPEAIRHLTAYHSWGTTTLLNEGANFKIYQVDILPHKKLSFHSHQHRNEHWIVLSGIATVLMDDKNIIYKKDESFFISQKIKHSIQNNEDTLLSLVEVRSGNFLIETDIERD